MKPALKKTFSAILIALASLVIVLGIASLAMVQGGINILPGRDGATATPTMAPSEGSGSGGSSGSIKPTTTDSTPLPEATPVTLACVMPQGWMPIIVREGQTLEQIANLYNTSVESLQQQNCLESTDITGVTVVFVPWPTQSRATSVQCGPPAGWVIYIVQPGDTLTSIAAMFGTSVNQLINANCLKTTTIFVGQRLFVPPNFGFPQPIIPTATPWITIPDLLTPEVPYLPTGIPFPIFPPTP
jgi:LysM repeat protein